MFTETNHTTPMHMYVHIYVRTRTAVYVYVRTHIYVHMYVVYTHSNVCMCKYIHAYMYICKVCYTDVYWSICVYVHVHTHIHACSKDTMQCTHVLMKHLLLICTYLRTYVHISCHLSPTPLHNTPGTFTCTIPITPLTNYLVDKFNTITDKHSNLRYRLHSSRVYCHLFCITWNGTEWSPIHNYRNRTCYLPIQQLTPSQ